MVFVVLIFMEIFLHKEMSKTDYTQDLKQLPFLLLVEDSQEIREQMNWGLKNLYTLFEADSRENAVEILQREKMVLVTLDLGLPPDVNGASEGLNALEHIQL